MAQEPDRLRRDIEETRASLTRDVDLLAEKTSPKRVVQRRWETAKEKVMGSSDSARHAAGDGASVVREKAAQVGEKAGSAAHDVADSVRGAPRAVAKQAQGNPLAAGIIAFGVGMLAATLMPVSDVERRVGRQLKDNAGDLTDQVKDIATELKDDLSSSVGHAVGEVKETARDAAQTTKDQARSSTQDATAKARSAAS